MNEVLAANEIEDELLRLGAEIYRSPMYTATYVLLGSDEKVCVKRNKSGVAVRKQPLVIHPRHAGGGSWEEICRLLGTPNMLYKNADLHGFPVAPTGQSKTGIAFGVPNVESLHSLVALLGGRIPGTEDSYQWQAAALEVDDDPESADTSPTERSRLIAARIGQGKFREDLLRYWGNACALTGSDITEVLIASHIKPWAAGTNSERLDPHNGLLLVANADRLFDRGLISFSDAGDLLAKSSISPGQLGALGLSYDMRLRKIENTHIAYLTVHRELHGFNTSRIS